MGKDSGDVETTYNPSKGPLHWIDYITFVEYSRKGAYLPDDCVGARKEVKNC